MKTREVRVVPVRRRRWLLVMAAVALVCAVLIAYFSYQYGLYKHGDIADRTANLSKQIVQEQSRNQALTAKLVDAEVAALVNQGTADELRASLAHMHNEQALLQEEVTFYRSLMAPSSLERGLQISEFALVARGDQQNGEQQRTFAYELLLTQVEARRSVVQGGVTVDVVGEREGEQVVLPLTEIEPQTDYPLKYRFRYFQDFSGTIELPDGVEPLRVVVTVTRQGSREANLQRTFDWVVEDGLDR